MRPFPALGSTDRAAPTQCCASDEHYSLMNSPVGGVDVGEPPARVLYPAADPLHLFAGKGRVDQYQQPVPGSVELSCKTPGLVMCQRSGTVALHL